MQCESLNWFSRTNQLLEKDGFECYPFKVGWYNDCVGKPFQLPLPYDSLAFVVLSTPQMFEKTFVPFIREYFATLDKLRDPIDECMKQYFETMRKVVEAESGSQVEVVHDFELHPNRRPKVLMQSAGHVAGAAFYYKNKWKPQSLGLSIHPKFGGWFAFRCVFLLPSLSCPPLERVVPTDVLPEEKQQKQILTQFDESWQDFEYRNCVYPILAKYSENQQKYFATNPKDRFALLEHLLHPCESL